MKLKLQIKEIPSKKGHNSKKNH